MIIILYLVHGCVCFLTLCFNLPTIEISDYRLHFGITILVLYNYNYISGLYLCHNDTPSS